MKVFEINGSVFGSTGKIMFGIADLLEKHGCEVLCAAPVTKTNRKKQLARSYIRIGNYFTHIITVLTARLSSRIFLGAYFSTRVLIKKISKFSPDILHLHNLHGDYINFPLLFRYIRKNNIKTVWTLHDCWSFTGHCPHYIIAGCDKWKTGCYKCKCYRKYPASLFDDSKRMYKLKKQWFCDTDNLILVTPSLWLKKQLEKSFLDKVPVKVINNGIDLAVFHPSKSNFRKKYGVSDSEIMILGVAFDWGYKKGLDVFIELSKQLTEKYRIVLVGTNDALDSNLPEGIITIRRTHDQNELAQIYSSADVFVNPTREDNYPTVNLEAIACGTPVITFNTGGAAEMINENCGRIIRNNDLNGLVDAIRSVKKKSPDAVSHCVQTALSFDETIKYQQYEEIYGLWEKSAEKN